MAPKVYELPQRSTLRTGDCWAQIRDIEKEKGNGNFSRLLADKGI